MKKIFVITFPIILILLIVIAFSVTDDSPGKGFHEVTREARVEARTEWIAAGPEARLTLCRVYNDPEISREDLFRQMTQGTNQVSFDKAEAKIQILEEECR